MKALILSGLGRNQEANDQIKKTLFKNLTNFTCWHVFGIINRKAKDYDQARKAYLNAHKYNPENDSVLKDLSQIQLHLRDFEGFRDTRRTLLVKDPNSKDVWTNFAVSCYLAEDYETTISTIETILKFNDEDKLVKKQMSPLSLMEVLVLKVKAFEKLGKLDEALSFMNEHR